MTLELEELTGRIIECAIKVHKKLGPGFLESIYQVALPIELAKEGLKAETQKEIRIYYDGKEMIFRDVITHEADQMLHWLQQVVAKQKSVGRKILSYMSGRLEYFRKVANLLDVSIQVLVEVKPLLDKIYKDVMKREIAFLSEIIQRGIDEGQIRSCDSTRVADGILAVSESLKFKGIHNSSGASAAEVDFAATDRDVNYIVKLILKGLTISK